jgi:murein L,D-transpeptidase YafK
MKEHKLMVVDYNVLPKISLYKCDKEENVNWKEEAAEAYFEFFNTCVPCGVIDILEKMFINNR